MILQNKKDDILKWKKIIQSLLQYINEIVIIALKAVIDLAPEGYLQPSPFESLLLPLTTSSSTRGSYDCSQNINYTSNSGQFIAVTSWRCIKEISLLIATLLRIIPLPKQMYLNPNQVLFNMVNI